MSLKWLCGVSYNPHVLADTTKHENCMMPPPVGDGFGPGTVGGPLAPCRSKAQELRANMSSNSLRFSLRF